MMNDRYARASGILLTMAFDPVLRWLMADVIPPRPAPVVPPEDCSRAC